MTETRFYEPARLSTPPKPLFSLKSLDATTWLRSLLSKVFRILGGRKLPVYFRIASRYLWFYDRGRMGSVKIAILSPHFQSLLSFVVLTWRSEASKNIRAPEEDACWQAKYERQRHGNWNKSLIRIVPERWPKRVFNALIPILRLNSVSVCSIPRSYSFTSDTVNLFDMLRRDPDKAGARRVTSHPNLREAVFCVLVKK